MAKDFSLKRLTDAVAGTAAALRCRNRLQPAGGPGTKVFPPTYAGAIYAVERRRLPREDGSPGYETVTCVQLDSVQSQANRMEEALQDAIDAKRLAIPVIEVNFTKYGPDSDVSEELRLLDQIGRVTSLQAPHRLADAILRDSVYEHNGESTPFRRSPIGGEIDSAEIRNATPLYQLCPTALVFGMWDSTGPKGGLGAKFERALVSEIVGVGCPYAFETNGDAKDQELPKNRGVRNDPLGIRSAARVKRSSLTDWEVADDPKAKGTLSPAEINHSNVPFEGSNCGITIDYAEQTTVISLPALRRLRFPPKGETWQATVEQRQRDVAAQTVLAALAICSAELAAEAGMDLRSRCLLWPEEPRRWELLDRPGQKPESISLEATAAIELLQEAVKAAEKLGLEWHAEPVRLSPSKQLVQLVRKSQEQAVVSGAEEGE
ncbi:MAG: type I-U CRISPR-associated RAMP protein Csb1/Cas7u [Pirellulaceae bacterium]